MYNADSMSQCACKNNVHVGACAMQCPSSQLPSCTLAYIGVMCALRIASFFLLYGVVSFLASVEYVCSLNC